MKRTLHKILASTLTIGLFALAAQAADPPQERPRPGGERPGGPGGDRPNFRAGMGLDDKQRELFREGMEKNREAFRPLEEKMRAAQKDLLTAVMAEKQDEKVIREKADAVAKIQTEMTLLRAKAFASVAPTLKPEQREQLANSPLGGAMLLGGGGGFGGGMTRGDMTRPREGGDGPRRGGEGGERRPNPNPGQ